MINAIKSLILCLCLLFCAQQSSGQQISVEAKLDTSAILLGDQTILRLQARLPVNQKISFPQLTDSVTNKILIVSSSKADTTVDKGHPENQIITRDYTITSFDTGYHAIPALKFSTSTDSIKTNTLFLEVLSVAIDTTKAIFDIKQPLAVNYTWLDWITDNWAWIAIALFGIIAIWALIYYFRKQPLNKVKSEKHQPYVPPHQIALEKLKNLRSSRLWESEVKQFHSELSDIIREYLEKRYAIHALEQTTAEIFAALKKSPISADEKVKLNKILTLADLVKFAKQKPDAAANELSIEHAINFVEQTQQNIQHDVNREEKNDNV
jgi:hypothetical protein